jgi:hypothetical protein
MISSPNQMNWQTLEDEIINKFRELKIEEDTFVEYTLQLLKEEEEEEDCVGIISEFLSQQTEEDVGAFVTEIYAQALEIKRDEVEKEEVLRKKKMDQESERTTGVLASFSSEPELVETRSKVRHERTREERAERERLLAKYGYETEDITENADGEEEIVFKTKKTETKLENISVTNAMLIKEKEQQKKFAQKTKHDAEVKRNKENLEKQKLEKELKKKGTQKREKVRG